ncbi:hypothetical protein evm_009645 [Chilo suppressalis]|nr:hypothetical protein evm_009645 [Chilo suppressalis]
MVSRGKKIVSLIINDSSTQGQHSSSESDSETVQHHTVVAADVHQVDGGLPRRRSGMYFCISIYPYYDNL